MIAVLEILEVCAREAGMKVPKNIHSYDKEKFPHWHVYSSLQLGAPMPRPTAHWENARLVASIPVEKLKTMTFADFIAEGFAHGRC